MAHRGVPYQNLYYLLTSMHMSSSMYDIAVVGGGPAGSTAAAFLSRADRRVIVFESEEFPWFHMGESLLPFSMRAFML
jgi:flavin-dependent dehydrogenase